MDASQESDDHRLTGRHPREARPSVPHRDPGRVEPARADPGPTQAVEPVPGGGPARASAGSDVDDVAADEDAPDGELDAVTRLMGFLRNSD